MLTPERRQACIVIGAWLVICAILGLALCIGMFIWGPANG